MRVFPALICLAAASLFPLAAEDLNWRAKLDAAVPLYGHRNWIVIADSAYPLQTREGIETVVTNASQFEVLRAVLAKLDESKHVTPIIWTDEELKFVPDADAVGASAFRDHLAQLMHNRRLRAMPHEQIISELDKAGQTFKVLILKTTMTIPYTSVFLQLDCAYWSPEAEQRLRAAMADKTSGK